MKEKINKIIRKLLNFLKKPNFYIFLFLSCVCFSSTNLIFSKTKEANDELISYMINDLSRKTTTGALNINLINRDKSKTQSEVSNICLYTYNQNISIYTGSFYNFRVAYSKESNVDIKIAEIEERDSGNVLDIRNSMDKDVTLLAHYSSGKPHKNKNEENIHEDYELALKFDTANGFYSGQRKDSIICIREELAKKLIFEKYGITSPNDKNYSDLIKDCKLNLEFTYEGVKDKRSYDICNIIEEKYYDTFLHGTFDEYLTIAASFRDFVPFPEAYSVNFDFGSSLFDTKQFLKLIDQEFPRDDYLFKIKKDIFQSYNNEIEKNASELETSFNLDVGSSDLKYILISMSYFLLFFILLFSIFLIKRSDFGGALIGSLIGYLISYCVFFVMSGIDINLSRFFIIKPLLINFIIFMILLFISVIFFKNKKAKIYECDI